MLRIGDARTRKAHSQKFADCGYELVTAFLNSSWESTVGSPSKEMPTLTKAVAVASTIKRLTCTV